MSGASEGAARQDRGELLGVEGFVDDQGVHQAVHLVHVLGQQGVNPVILLAGDAAQFLVDALGGLLAVQAALAGQAQVAAVLLEGELPSLLMPHSVIILRAMLVAC